VVTCFPGCWVEEDIPNAEDPTDLLERIVRHVSKRDSYARIKSSHDLASIIIELCASNVTDMALEKRQDLDRYHFLEWFYRSIRRVVSFNSNESKQICSQI